MPTALTVKIYFWRKFHRRLHLSLEAPQLPQTENLDVTAHWGIHYRTLSFREVKKKPRLFRDKNGPMSIKCPMSIKSYLRSKVKKSRRRLRKGDHEEEEAAILLQTSTNFISFRELLDNFGADPRTYWSKDQRTTDESCCERCTMTP